MWIVAVDLEYYPWVEEYETYEEAKKSFDGHGPEDNVSIFLAEVKERK